MRFSIILPVRNGGNYVHECVNSILHQTLNDFDLAVLDNCSTDGTLEWIQSLKDPRIKIYPAEKPLTIEENWARITAIPKNEFMTMIGHDDLLMPFYLEEMDALIKLHPLAGLYQTHYSFIDHEGRFIRHCLPMDQHQLVQEFLACQLARTIDSTGTGYMMRSADYDRAGGIPARFPHLIFADYALWTSLMQNGYKATSARDCFSYRLHQSVSQTTNGMLFQQALGEYVSFVKSLMNDDPAIQSAVLRYGGSLLMYYCESLSHRLLRTARNKRSLTVKAYIKICEGYAASWIPGQEFEPMKKIRIRAARWIDTFYLTRLLFRLIR